ncbi:MAG: YgiT-type zinc finger protein [Candidatus Binatia bacterium]
MKNLARLGLGPEVRRERSPLGHSEQFETKLNRRATSSRHQAPLPHTACSECGGTLRRRMITEEFERGGHRVSVSGIRALVCTKCRQVYFEPGGAQALVEAVDSLFALARRNRQRKGKLSAAVS